MPMNRIHASEQSKSLEGLKRCPSVQDALAHCLTQMHNHDDYALNVHLLFCQNTNHDVKVLLVANGD